MKTIVKVTIIALIALKINAFAQEPITFFKNANLDSLGYHDWSIFNPVELSDRYVFQVGLSGGMGLSGKIAAIFSKEGELLAAVNFQPPSNYSLNGAFKKWGNDSLLYSGETYSYTYPFNGTVTYMLDKDCNLLWQLSIDSGFLDLQPINDSIAIGYGGVGTRLFDKGGYIGYVNYKTGKIVDIKFLNELQGYPFGLKDTTLFIDQGFVTSEYLWFKVFKHDSNYISTVQYTISDSSTIYQNGIYNAWFKGAYKDQLLFTASRNSPNKRDYICAMPQFQDTTFTYSESAYLDSTDFIYSTCQYYQSKIHVFSTYKSNNTKYGLVTQLSPTGELLHRIELTDLATDAIPMNPFAIYEPVQMIPTSDGGYLFTVKSKNDYTLNIMKMDSTFHVRNSDVGVYIGVEETIMAEKSNRISLFPNPTTSHFTIQSRSNIKSLTVYNLQGQQLLQKSNLNANGYTVEEQLPSGVYAVKVETEEGMEVRKVLVGSDNGL